MKVINSISEYRNLKLPEPVGFVPTMGYLHAGHISLVKRAKAENNSVVVSIFINPTQFAPTEDLIKYPRDLPRDLEMLEKAGTDVVFVPPDEEMYPGGYNTWVEVAGITQRLEGASRPTHFRGVTTVVAKLFNIVEPQNAYFGQKDAQQLLVIKKLVNDLDMNLKLITCPTVREKDGLAMSSRNTYLTSDQRKAAPVLYRSLQLARAIFFHGERNADVIKKHMTNLITREPLASIDYISINDTESLEDLPIIVNSALVSMAVRFGKVRLIDNTILGIQNSNP
jgi:pantoate--beta-alanine ligase